MSIENALKGFATSTEPGALVLQGKWGLGKTHFWKRKIIDPLQKDANTSSATKRYSYVSMFGTENLSDLKASVFQATYEVDSAAFLSAKGWRISDGGGGRLSNSSPMPLKMLQSLMFRALGEHITPLRFSPFAIAAFAWTTLNGVGPTCNS